MTCSDDPGCHHERFLLYPVDVLNAKRIKDEFEIENARARGQTLERRGPEGGGVATAKAGTQGEGAERAGGKAAGRRQARTLPAAVTQ